MHLIKEYPVNVESVGNKMKKTSKVKKATKAKGKQTKKTDKLPWTTEDIKKYCEEAGYRIVLTGGPQAPCPANSDSKGLWDKGTTYFPEGSTKGVKI